MFDLFHLNIAKRFPEFVSGVFSRCTLNRRHCLPQVIITFITYLKISVLFPILCCLSLSNERDAVKSGLLNRALNSSSFDIFVSTGVVMFLRLFSRFVPLAKA